jgi:hypothetical protein
MGHVPPQRPSIRTPEPYDAADEPFVAELADLWDEFEVNPGLSVAAGMVAVGMLAVVIGIIISGAF